METYECLRIHIAGIGIYNFVMYEVLWKELWKCVTLEVLALLDPHRWVEPGGLALLALAAFLPPYLVERLTILQ